MKPIAVGDLVRIIRNHGCSAMTPTRGLGYVYIVDRIDVARDWQCHHCCAVDHSLDGQVLTYGILMGKGGYYPVAWVKRIPPLSELDDARQDEEIAA